MNTVEDDYPCVGVCMIDAYGYCIGCGRPSPPEPTAQLNERGRTDDQSPAEPERGKTANRAD